jgi:hypothetical protein
MIAGAIAVLVQGGFIALLSAADLKPVLASLSDDNAKPVSVAIVPIPDDLPMLKAGGKPAALPDMWKKPPKAVQKKTDEGAPPSTKADPNAPPTTPSDAGVATTDATALDPVAGDASTDPNTASSGFATGSDSGTSLDPAKAHAINQYRAELNAWFSARFNIRGKIPFDTLKTLRATVTVTVTDDRRVGGYDLWPGSGNDVFDDQLLRDMAKVQVSGAVLPPPPENYPDILGTKLKLTFSCTVKASCE